VTLALDPPQVFENKSREVWKSQVPMNLFFRVVEGSNLVG
jgi:hypothetical protein